MSNLLFFIPIIVLIASFCISYFLVKRGANKKIVCISQFGSFILTFVISSICGAQTVFADTVSSSSASVSGENSMAYAIGLVAASIAFGLGAIASGIALASALPAAIAATSENDKLFAKSMMFVAFGESMALYGIVIAVLVMGNLKNLVGA